MKPSEGSALVHESQSAHKLKNAHDDCFIFRRREILDSRNDTETTAHLEFAMRHSWNSPLKFEDGLPF
jgi:hypothetical protein